MTRREILTFLHANQHLTLHDVAAGLRLPPPTLLSELQGLAAYGVVDSDDAKWMLTKPTLEESIRALEDQGEDPDLELTAQHPLQGKR